MISVTVFFICASTQIYQFVDVLHATNIEASGSTYSEGMLPVFISVLTRPRATEKQLSEISIVIMVALV